MNDKWITRWPVVGTSGKKYTVAQDREGNFGCDCQSWMFQPRERWLNGKRRDCQHILNKKLELLQAGTITSFSLPSLDDKKSVRIVRLED